MPPAKLSDVANSFVWGVNQLRVFVERIGRAADEYDKTAHADFAEALKKILPESAQQWMDVREDASQANTAQSGVDSTDRGEHKREMPEAVRVELVKAFKEPGRLERFIAVSTSLIKASPAQGDMLRRGALVSLMSHFEALIADIIHFFYHRFPAALPADEQAVDAVHAP